MKILIADDHEGFRRRLRPMIEAQADWHVCGEANDGIEALEKARQLRPDLVLMDMSMPRMDGTEATRLICQEIPGSRVILFSQNDPIIVSEMAAQAGALASLSKNNLAQDLVPAIRKLLQANSAKTSGAGDWLFGGGKLASLMRHYDWSRTPLGPIQDWPNSIRTAVNLMLNSQHPMWIGWGPEITFLYNDAYISVLSLAKHPWALGRPASEVWSEIWDVCSPLADKVFDNGEPSFMDDVRLFMNRGESLEETYYSFSYSPIYDESGKVAGLFCPSTEITSKVLHARRLRTLSELSSTVLAENSAQAACASCIKTISQNVSDVPFALLYLVDAEIRIATLEGASQIQPDVAPVSPRQVSLEGDGTKLMWPIRELVREAQPRIVPIGRLESIPLGSAGQAVREAIVLPVTSVGMDHPVAVLVAGINPTRKLDTEYRTFFSLVADQVGTAIQNARAMQQEKQRADALAELDRAKTAFFSNVSHEFRTPLTLMMGPLEDAIAQSKELSDTDRERLQMAHRNSLRLLKLVNTLLDFSRIEAGRLQACYEPTDLARLTTELASIFRSAIERAGMSLTVDCPSLNENVYIDREMWEKIVLNLLSNAFKFTFTGGIEVSLRNAGTGVELEGPRYRNGHSCPRTPSTFRALSSRPGRSRSLVRRQRDRARAGAGVGQTARRRRARRKRAGHGQHFYRQYSTGKRASARRSNWRGSSIRVDRADRPGLSPGSPALAATVCRIRRSGNVIGKPLECGSRRSGTCPAHFGSRRQLRHARLRSAPAAERIQHSRIQ